MNIDLQALLAWLQNIDPLVAFAVAAVVLIVQRRLSGKSLALGEILTSLLALLKGLPSPQPLSPGPSEPGPKAEPSPNESDTLLEILAKRILARLKAKIQQSGGDDHVAVQFYSRIVEGLNRTDVRPTPPPTAPDAK